LPERERRGGVGGEGQIEKSQRKIRLLPQRKRHGKKEKAKIEFSCAYG